jgi:hypothetical protein
MPIIFELRKRRLATNLTCHELGLRIGCDKWSVGVWERGYRQPTIRNVTDWCNALGCDLRLAEISQD